MMEWLSWVDSSGGESVRLYASPCGYSIYTTEELKSLSSPLVATNEPPPIPPPNPRNPPRPALTRPPARPETVQARVLRQSQGDEGGAGRGGRCARVAETGEWSLIRPVLVSREVLMRACVCSRRERGRDGRSGRSRWRWEVS